MPTESITLEVQAGVNVTPSTPVDNALLNLLGVPLVRLIAEGLITPAFLNLPLLGDALAAYLAPVNWITRPNFWARDWEAPDGKASPVGEYTMNALDWYCVPTGAAITVSRVESAPDSKSVFAAQLLGAVGCTSCDYGVWVPASIAGQLRGNTLTFSVWVKNLTDAAINLKLAVFTAASRDALNEVVEVAVSGNIAADDGEWTRCSYSFDASAFANFPNGVFLALRTTNLTTAIKALHVAQGQFEIGNAVTAFVRPHEPALPPGGDVIYPDAAEDPTTAAFDVVMQNRITGEKKVLRDPPAIFARPVLGFDRATGRPRWEDLEGNMVVFEYTGFDQVLTVPAGASFMEIHAWGAGGGNDAPGDFGLVKGGVGGYAKGKFAVTPATQYKVVVGEGAHGLARAAYGFGGAGQGAAHQHNGGGLSGVFTGAGDVVAGDTARALVVAGGGGAGGQSGGGANAVQGGNGNDGARAGGQANFQGIHSTGGVTSGNGGGGGGWRGGIGLGLGGKGGTSIVHSAGTPVAGQAHAQGTDVVVTAAAFPSLIVPGSTLDEYVSPAGQSGRCGLVVVIFT